MTILMRNVTKHKPLQWCHNGCDGVSNHQPHDCLLTRLFRRRSEETPNLRVTGLCEGNSPVTGEFPAQKASNAGNVSIWWRHHEPCAWFWCVFYNLPDAKMMVNESQVENDFRTIFQHCFYSLFSLRSHATCNCNNVNRLVTETSYHYNVEEKIYLAQWQ